MMRLQNGSTCLIGIPENLKGNSSRFAAFNAYSPLTFNKNNRFSYTIQALRENS